MSGRSLYDQENFSDNSFLSEMSEIIDEVEDQPNNQFPDSFETLFPALTPKLGMSRKSSSSLLSTDATTKNLGAFSTQSKFLADIKFFQDAEEEQKLQLLEWIRHKWGLGGSEELLSPLDQEEDLTLFSTIYTKSSVGRWSEDPAKSCHENELLQALLFVLIARAPRKCFSKDSKLPLNYDDLLRVNYDLQRLLNVDLLGSQDFVNKFSEIIESDNLQQYADFMDSPDHWRLVELLDVYNSFLD